MTYRLTEKLLSLKKQTTIIIVTENIILQRIFLMYYRVYFYCHSFVR